MTERWNEKLLLLDKRKAKKKEEVSFYKEKKLIFIIFFPFLIIIFVFFWNLRNTIWIYLLWYKRKYLIDDMKLISIPVKK